MRRFIICIIGLIFAVGVNVNFAFAHIIPGAVTAHTEGGVFPSFGGLLIMLVIISSFGLIGSLTAYFILPKISGNKKPWELFSAYLMVLLSLELLSIQLLNGGITKLSAPGLLKGFLAGSVIVFLMMLFYSWITNSKREKREHAAGHGISLGIVVFLILAIHELMEGASVAELFSETGTVSLVISLIPLFLLALHEFPEGLLLVVPFFLEKRIKFGIFAAFTNQLLFIGSGIIFFRFLQIDISVANDAFFSTLPAGGIFYLGLHEFRHAMEHRRDLKLFYSHRWLKIASLVSFSAVLLSLFLVSVGVRAEKAKTVSAYPIDSKTGQSVANIDVGTADLVTTQKEVLCYVKGEKKFGREPENPPKEYSVVAENNQFTPNYFHFYHGASSILRVFAKDRDYSFEIKGSGINIADLKQNETTEIQLETLGMGRQYFYCGFACGGTVFVDRDLDDYCETDLSWPRF